jgi:predicted ATPase
MFTRVEVRNFKSLRDVSVPLSNFHVLVGANGSGKSSFLDVFAFMGDLLNGGLQEALRKRKVKWEELVFNGLEGLPIQFNFEAKLPDSIYESSKLDVFDSVRYNVQLFWRNGRANIDWESGHLFKSSNPPNQWRNPESSPIYHAHLHSLHDAGQPNWETITGIEILNRSGTERCEILTVDNLEVTNYRFGNEVLALGEVPEDLDKFPALTWLKSQFKKFIQPINIESDAINKAGMEGSEGIVTHDGSNLPWLIASLKKTAPDRYKRWIRHVQIVMPEIKSINTVMREDQDDMFLKIKYKEGNGVKQWMVSDGTLRLLLLTIIPYLLNLKGLFLIEEPEIGINPLAIQAIMDSLRSVWDEQVFVTTHSPEVVNCVMKKDLLLFIKNETGETQIISGTEHRGLTNWTLDIGSGVFYGAGIMR